MPSQDSGRLAKTPDAEVAIETGLVRSLLQNQHPDLAHLELALVDAGWDNVMFRLGDRLAIRHPRRQAAAALIKHEQTRLLTNAVFLVDIRIECMASITKVT